jgi:hypothetical protein
LTRLGWYKHLSVHENCTVFAGPYRDSWQNLNPGKPIPPAEFIKALRLSPPALTKQSKVQCQVT